LQILTYFLTFYSQIANFSQGLCLPTGFQPSD
jgi:hypothetical protein